MAKKDKSKDDDQVEKRGISATNEKVTETEVSVAADTLVGDLRDALLGKVRSMKKPWEKMSESEQRDTVEQLTNAAKHLTKNAVLAIAANGRNTIHAKLVSFNGKDGLKAIVEMPMTDEALLQLAHATGRSILLVASGHEQYEGERNPAEIDPDQGDLERKLGASGTREAA